MINKNMTQVSHHSSVVIMHDENQGRFLLGRYDDTYPRTSQRGRVKPVGGNYSPRRPTSSPKELLDRELNEEFSIHEKDHSTEDLEHILGASFVGPAKRSLFAPESDIRRLLEIGLSAEPHQDFIAEFPSLDDRPAFSYVESVFVSTIPIDFMDILEDHLRNGRSIRNEGDTVIVNIGNLLSGKILFAWGSGKMVGHYLGKDIPNPNGVKITPIGLPRASFKEYNFLVYQKPPF